MSVSVVIPAYNAAKYLNETIDSVLNQTLPPDEIIVVDDQSTDDTAQIAESYGTPVKVIRKKNQGPSVARNVGMNHATSEWIALLDADDVWEPNKLQRQMEELQRSGADVCYTGFVVLQHEGDRTFLGKIHEAPPANNIRQALFDDPTSSFLPSSVVVRRSTMLKVGGFDESARQGVEDMRMWLTLLHSGAKFASCPEPLYRYRRHSTNWNIDRVSFDGIIKTYRDMVLPYLPRSSRWFVFNGYRSQHECDLAYALRKKGDKSCLEMMASSVIHSPFHEPIRYKVLAHMVYTSLMRNMKKVPARAQED